MAKVRKREGKNGVSWQIDYFDPTGKRIRKSFKKKKDAEAELGKRVSLMAEKRYLDVKKEYKTTLDELLKKYEENYKDQASFKQYKLFFLNNFREHFGKDTLLANIRYVDLETYRNHLKRKPTRQGTVRTVATINREMTCLHHVFKKGVAWEMLESNPFDRGESLLQKENNKRLRFLSQGEIQRLLEASKDKKYLYNIIVCALNTGMRRGEILSLKWNQIKNGFIYLSRTKTNEARQIPINDTLANLFDEIRREQKVVQKKKRKAKHLHVVKMKASTGYVFTYQGVSIKRIDRAFSAVLKTAGIEDCKFHDLRHTFASHLVMNGASLR